MGEQSLCMRFPRFVVWVNTPQILDRGLHGNENKMEGYNQKRVVALADKVVVVVNDPSKMAILRVENPLLDLFEKLLKLERFTKQIIYHRSFS
jgi:hypothetical protein